MAENIRGFLSGLKYDLFPGIVVIHVITFDLLINQNALYCINIQLNRVIFLLKVIIYKKTLICYTYFKLNKVPETSAATSISL